MANEELNSSLSIRQISRLRSSGSDEELLSGILRRRGKETQKNSIRNAYIHLTKLNSKRAESFLLPRNTVIWERLMSLMDPLATAILPDLVLSTQQDSRRYDRIYYGHKKISQQCSCTIINIISMVDISDQLIYNSKKKNQSGIMFVYLTLDEHITENL